MRRKLGIGFLIISVFFVIAITFKVQFFSPVKKSEIIFSEQLISKIFIRSDPTKIKEAQQTVMSFEKLGQKLGIEFVEMGEVALVEFKKDFFAGNILIEGVVSRELKGHYIFVNLDGTIAVDSIAERFNSEQKLTASAKLKFEDESISIYTIFETPLSAAARDSGREWELRVAAEKTQKLMAAQLLD